MKKLQIIIVAILLAATANAQETVYPSPKQTAPILITNGTIHVGNGQVFERTSILIVDGKISQVGTSVTAPAGAQTIDALGKQIYPGLILANTDLGLVEVPSVRATSDVREIGMLNPSIRSIVAYNTDSKVINPLRSQGILLANIVPEGGMVSGSSSVVQLDGWNWEDAAYKMENGIHINMPALIAAPARGRFARMSAEAAVDPVKQGLEQVDELKSFLQEAKAYATEKTHDRTNLKFVAVKGLFDRSQKLFVHANTVKQILVALDFVKTFNVDMVIVGGTDSWQVADLLKQNNVAVILNQPHNLPTLEDDDVDQPYKTPYLLQKAGVLFAINDDNGETRGRNLMYNAGTAAAYGLTKEQALASITLNAAKILGVGDKTGSIEVGKDANLFFCTGDVLDMRTSIVTDALIQGRKINLDNKQKQLYEKYKYKYGFQ